MSAASGAVAITAAELRRIPLRISGSASGTCTLTQDARSRSCPCRAPTRRSPRSTWRIAVNVKVKIGGIASSTSATITGVLPDPEPDHAEHEHRERRDRATDVGDVDGDTPERRLRPSSSAAGHGDHAARSTIAHAHSTRCSSTRCGMPFEPCQLAGSLNHTKSVVERSSSARRRPSGPRREQRARCCTSSEVERDRERDGEHRADEQRRVEEAVEPVEDEPCRARPGRSRGCPRSARARRS